MANVLVVEDEPTVQVLVHDLLEAWGHRVDAASTGEGAIECLRAQEYDVVVLDLMLGEVSGYDVLDELTRLGQRDRTRVIVLTARATEWDYLLGWMRGADGYVTKPFDPVVFQELIKETISRSRSELEDQRRSELEKSQLLFKLESTFNTETGSG